MLKDVVEVRPLGTHRLYLRFEDGVAGEIDVAALIPFDGVFEALRVASEFARVRVDAELGVVCWPNGADLDPDVLYAEIKSAAKPTSRPSTQPVGEN